MHKPKKRAGEAAFQFSIRRRTWINKEKNKMIPVIITASKKSLEQILFTLTKLYGIYPTKDETSILNQLNKQLAESKDLVCPLLKKE